MELLTDRITEKKDSYEALERKYGYGHNRICINGKTTGCGNCVGYCSYQDHPGFLTESLRKEHDCLSKGCKYYTEKKAPIRHLKLTKDLSDQKMLFSAREAVSEMEGLRVLRAVREGATWLLKYVTITNDYVLEPVAKALTRDCCAPVRFEKLDYSFDICVKLIMEG